VGTIAKTVAMHNLAEESTKHLKAFTITKQGHFPVTARLYVSSCESMDGVADESVTLTVTSPPYWNAIDYERYSKDPNKSYRTRKYSNGFDDYNSYLDWLTNIFSETLKKTRPGGYLAVVIGIVLFNGTLYPVPFDLVVRLSSAGWLFHQDIVWHKVTGGVKRAGVFIKHPYPGYYYPNIMAEYIMVFRKPGEPIYRKRSQDVYDKSEYELGALFTKEVANNIWHIAPVPPNTIEHPCPFPEEIPYRLIQLYSYPGDVVLDPFLGSGQTAKVAFALERNTIGYDTIESYVTYAFKRLKEPLAVRPYQLIPQFLHIPLNAPLGYGGRTRNQKTRHGSGITSKLVEKRE